jgi:hypothetical protein
MAREADPQHALEYASPRPLAPRPAHLGVVGCGSSLVGGVLLGVVLPWMALRNFVYDDPPALVGWGLTVVAAALIGGVIGALVVPAISLSVYWVIWRIRGRP